MAKIVVSLLYSFVFSIFCGCGGGFPPDDLSQARVEMNAVNMRKSIIFRNPDIGLIDEIFAASNGSDIILRGYNEAFVLTYHESSGTWSHEKSSGGIKSSIISENGLLNLDLDGDEIPDKVVPAEGGFAIQIEKPSAEVHRIILEEEWWYQPTATSSIPHYIIISLNGVIAIYDSKGIRISSLDVPGLEFPMHVKSGCFLSESEKGSFACTLGGRGGWHRAKVIVHDDAGKIVYSEILKNDFPAIWPLPLENGLNRFLVGGRGIVYEYSFRSED